MCWRPRPPVALRVPGGARGGHSGGTANTANQRVSPHDWGPRALSPIVASRSALTRPHWRRGIFVHGEARWAQPAATAEHFRNRWVMPLPHGRAALFTFLVMLVERFGARLAERRNSHSCGTLTARPRRPLSLLAHRNPASSFPLRRIVMVRCTERCLVLVAEHVAGVRNVFPDALPQLAREPGM
jgi:hypothetical protein